VVYTLPLLPCLTYLVNFGGILLQFVIEKMGMVGSIPPPLGKCILMTHTNLGGTSVLLCFDGSLREIHLQALAMHQTIWYICFPIQFLKSTWPQESNPISDTRRKSWGTRLQFYVMAFII